MLFTMEKERLGAFMYAVLAIIMTILVLDLKEPKTFDLQGLWELRESFFAYTLSFFWLGTMWINLHREYSAIEKISQKTVWAALLVLFFSSLFPYATRLISLAFYSSSMQVVYGVISLLISISVLYYTYTLEEANPKLDAVHRYKIKRLSWMKWDMPIKLIGLILSATLFPPAMSLAILFNLCILVIPHQLKN